MDAEIGGGDGREEGLEDRELEAVVAEVVALADGLDKEEEEGGGGAARGIGLATDEGVGDEFLDAVDGGLGDLEDAGGGGIDEGAEDGVGVGEGELGGAVVDGAGDLGFFGCGGDGRVSWGRRRWRWREAGDDGFALMGEFGLFARRGVFDDHIEGWGNDQQQAGIGFRRSHSRNS